MSTGVVMTDEDIRALAELDRDMDSGKQTFVFDKHRNRWAFPPNILAQVGVVSGQTCSDIIILALQDRNLADLRTQVALEKAAKT